MCTIVFRIVVGQSYFLLSKLLPPKKGTSDNIDCFIGMINTFKEGPVTRSSTKRETRKSKTSLLGKRDTPKCANTIHKYPIHILMTNSMSNFKNYTYEN